MVGVGERVIKTRTAAFVGCGVGGARDLLEPNISVIVQSVGSHRPRLLEWVRAARCLFRLKIATGVQSVPFRYSKRQVSLREQVGMRTNRPSKPSPPALVQYCWPPDKALS